MNCRPGDLCVIRNMDWTPEANGHFVTVVKLLPADHFDNEGCPEPAWLVRGHCIPDRLSTGHLVFVKERVAGDAYLLPIRPQSDDATDESADWLPPVPTPQREVA